VQDQQDPSQQSLGDVRRAVLQLLDGIRTNLPAHTLPAQSTVRDVVLTRPRTYRCVLGALSSSVSTSRIRNQRSACAGYKCPHCIDYRLCTDTVRFMRLWGFPTEIYQRTFTAQEWEARRGEARSIRTEHPFYLCVRSATGDRIMLSPDPITDCERLPTIPALVAAFMAAPVRGRRFDLARSQERRAADADISAEDQGRAGGGDTERLWGRVASHHNLESVDRAYDTALRDYASWATEHGARGAPFSAADERAITEVQHPVAVRVWHELRAEHIDELEQQNDTRRILRESAETVALLQRLATGAEV
jgi:hypothetical protein